DIPLLVHQQRSVVRPHLLGEQIGHFRRPEADASGRGDRLPEGHPTPATKLDRRHLHQSDPLRQGRQGRALRGLGTARDPGQRNPHRPAHPSFLTPTRGHSHRATTLPRGPRRGIRVYRDNKTWSTYGAERTQPTATVRKRIGPTPRTTTCYPLRTLATTCQRCSMVRRGSTVRVRQRALCFCLLIRLVALSRR